MVSNVSFRRCGPVIEWRLIPLWLVNDLWNGPAASIPSDPDPKPGAFFTTMERSWLLPRIGLKSSTVQWIGIILVVLATLGFVLAGLGGLGVPGLSEEWQTLAVFSACVSLLLLTLF